MVASSRSPPCIAAARPAGAHRGEQAVDRKGPAARGARAHTSCSHLPACGRGGAMDNHTHAVASACLRAVVAHSSLNNRARSAKRARRAVVHRAAQALLLGRFFFICPEELSQRCGDHRAARVRRWAGSPGVFGARPGPLRRSPRGAGAAMGRFSWGVRGRSPGTTHDRFAEGTSRYEIAPHFLQPSRSNQVRGW